MVGDMGHMGGLQNPPLARTIPSRFFKYRWVSQASKEGAVSKKVILSDWFYGGRVFAAVVSEYSTPCTVCLTNFPRSPYLNIYVYA